jgi:hypothetical protein
MGRPCNICRHRQRQAIEEMILAGASDYTVSRQFNLERTGVLRHRREHVIKPAQDRLTLISKGTAEQKEREQLARAAAADTPSTEAIVEANLGMRAHAQLIADIRDCLRQARGQAADNGSPTGVATVVAQELRSIEVGSRLAGTGGYANTRMPDQVGAGTPFSVNIIFNSIGRTESFTTTARAPVVDSADFEDRSEDRHMGQGEDPGGDQDEDDR